MCMKQVRYLNSVTPKIDDFFKLFLIILFKTVKFSKFKSKIISVFKTFPFCLEIVYIS